MPTTPPWSNHLELASDWVIAEPRVYVDTSMDRALIGRGRWSDVWCGWVGEQQVCVKRPHALQNNLPLVSGNSHTPAGRSYMTETLTLLTECDVLRRAAGHPHIVTLVGVAVDLEERPRAVVTEPLEISVGDWLNSAKSHTLGTEVLN